MVMVDRPPPPLVTSSTYSCIDLSSLRCASFQVMTTDGCHSQGLMGVTFPLMVGGGLQADLYLGRCYRCNAAVHFIFQLVVSCQLCLFVSRWCVAGDPFYLPGVSF